MKKYEAPPTQADYLKGALERQLDTFRRSAAGRKTTARTYYDWAEYQAANLIAKFLEKEIETL